MNLTFAGKKTKTKKPKHIWCISNPRTPEHTWVDMRRIRMLMGVYIMWQRSLGGMLHKAGATMREAGERLLCFLIWMSKWFFQGENTSLNPDQGKIGTHQLGRHFCAAIFTAKRGFLQHMEPWLRAAIMGISRCKMIPHKPVLIWEASLNFTSIKCTDNYHKYKKSIEKGNSSVRGGRQIWNAP